MSFRFFYFKCMGCYVINHHLPYLMGLFFTLLTSYELLIAAIISLSDFRKLVYGLIGDSESLFRLLFRISFYFSRNNNTLYLSYAKSNIIYSSPIYIMCPKCNNCTVNIGIYNFNV